MNVNNLVKPIKKVDSGFISIMTDYDKNCIVKKIRYAHNLKQ